MEIFKLFTGEKMIYSILLLVVLTASVCGRIIVSVTQTSYHAEENSNIMMEWTFTPNLTLTDLNIDCALWLSDHKTFRTLYHLQKGVEHPESEDEQFAGRARWDKDDLRQGHIRLHLSRLHINDSGVYQCEVFTSHDEGVSECLLNVTTAKHLPEDPEQRGYGGTVIAAVIGALVVLVVVVVLIVKRSPVMEFLRRVCGRKERGSGHQANANIELLTD